MQFVVFDQGVGIPETLPRSSKWESVREYMEMIPVVGSASNDNSFLIESAIEVSRTSLGGGHGRGLKDVVEPVANLRGGRVRIFSGRGSYIRYGDGKVEKDDKPLHIGGTLIEWTIPTGSAETGASS